MTRINVIPVSELSDQWLLAEYHELPRCIKQDINTSDAPDYYVLGKGHMKWAKKHSPFLFLRYRNICREMNHRGFKVNYPADKFNADYLLDIRPENDYSYLATTEDRNINKERLIEKYKLKPSYYKWTKRNKPLFIKEIKDE